MANRKIFSEDQLIKGEPPKSALRIIGNQYEWLTVIRYAGRYLSEKGYNAYYVVCRCKCGKEILANCWHISYGNWLSCGCRKLGEYSGRFVHGRTNKKDKVYTTWKGRNKRCYTKSDEAYERYGGVGISVCSGWRGKTGFINFRNDMGELPSKEYSIDRIDFTKNYSCGHCAECIENEWTFNCRWADKYTQARNKSNNKYVFIEGEKLTYAEAERKLGFGHGIIQGRLDRDWTIDKAISTPIMFSQRTLANHFRLITGWEFNNNASQSDKELFVSLWKSLKPTPITKSKKQLKRENEEIILKHLNL